MNIKDQIGQTNQVEAWVQLQLVKRKLPELEKLAVPDTMQSFVWELNDFLSSARKVVNYLRYEPGRPTGFDEWQKPEYEKLVSGNARFAFFRKLRNVSDKNCAIVPRMAGICDRVVAEIALSDKKETEFKHPETGETVAVFLRAKNSGAGDKIVVHKRSPRYVLDGWPSEDVLTFLSNIVATLDDFVCRAYAAYPNEASVFLTK